MRIEYREILFAVQVGNALATLTADALIVIDLESLASRAENAMGNVLLYNYSVVRKENFHVITVFYKQGLTDLLRDNYSSKLIYLSYYTKSSHKKTPFAK